MKLEAQRSASLKVFECGLPSRISSTTTVSMASLLMKMLMLLPSTTVNV